MIVSMVGEKSKDTNALNYHALYLNCKKNIWDLNEKNRYIKYKPVRVYCMLEKVTLIFLGMLSWDDIQNPGVH